MGFNRKFIERQKSNSYSKLEFKSNPFILELKKLNFRIKGEDELKENKKLTFFLK